MKHVPLQYGSANEPWSFAYLDKAVTPLLPELHKGLRVLDVGCGNGFWLGRLAQQECTTVGIDPSETGIAHASQAYPELRFERMEASEDICERLGEEPFDLVLSLEVVEHLYSPRQWARGCFNALKPGGRLICSTPYHGYLKNLAISLLNKWDSHFSPNSQGGHIKFWSKLTLIELLRETGFRTEDVGFRGAGRLPLFWKSMVLNVLR